MRSLSILLSQSQSIREMAKAMTLGVEAGRLAYLSERIPRTEVASPSSPEIGLVGSTF